MLDSQTAVVLSGGSLVTRLDIASPHQPDIQQQGTWSQWGQYRVAGNFNLRRIVGDGSGGLFGVSQTDDEVQIHRFTLPIQNIIRPGDSNQEFTQTSLTSTEEDDGDGDSNGDANSEDEENFLSIPATLVASFTLDPGQSEELTDFQIRGNVLTVTTRADVAPTQFTRLRSFDVANNYRVVAEMNSGICPSSMSGGEEVWTENLYRCCTVT